MKDKTIHIVKKAPILRDDAVNIKTEAGGAADVTVDFSEVTFISRAFGDELLNVIEQMKAEGKEVHLKKMNAGAKKMLQLVKRQRKNIRRELEKALKPKSGG